MGFDPVTVGLGVSAVSGLYGAFSQNKANKQAQAAAGQNFDWQKQAYGDAQSRLDAHNKQIQDLITPYLSGSGFNTGQDGMMQSMRGLPDGRFDTSDYFSSIKKLSNQDLNDQIAAQRGSVGSLGQRFGTANLATEARLRERATTNLGAQYNQIGMQSWEAAQNRSQGKLLSLLGLLSGQQVTPGMPVPQQQIIPGQNAIPGAIGDVGNMALLYPFLKGMTGGGGGGSSPYIPRTPLGTPGGIPSTLFGGVRY